MSSAKECQLCGTKSKVDEPTCKECGEASWYFPNMANLFDNPEASLDEEGAPKRRRVRKDRE